MEYRDFKGDIKLSVIGMGTYYDPPWILLSRLGIYRGRERKIKAIRAGLSLGINFIDTAELYNTEEMVKEAVGDVKRDEVFIASKAWITHLSYDGLLKAARRSAQRLGSKYIDLYYVHFPPIFHSISEVMRGMERLLNEGIIRHIGVSNFSLSQMVEAQGSLGKAEIAAVQMPYSLADRRIESDIIPYTKKSKISLICYYPLGHGSLVSPRNSKIVERISERHGGKSMAQIALNWIISKHENAFPIPRASNPDHVVENAGAAGWRLDEDEIKTLEGEFSR